MTLSQYQKDKFAEYKAVIAALTVADLEASTKVIIKTWEIQWNDYVFNDDPPGTDRPPNKPDHP